MLFAPGATATWMAYGTHEPDTEYDTSDWMWDSAAAPGVKQVYFNAYSIMLAPPLVSVVGYNPNVGALGTRNEVPHNEYHEALLGVWTDCNGDNYVGMAEGALREYPSQLLLDDTLCKPLAGTPGAKWPEGQNNYRGIVTEFVPIVREPRGGGESELSRDLRVYRDEDARVWGDFHRPDEEPTHRSCALRPFPRGTLSSTGGMMNYLDCRIELLEAGNLVLGAAGNPGGLSFSDADDARSGTLGQQRTFGSEDSASSPVYVWDCTGPQVARTGDVINQTRPVSPIPSDNVDQSIHNTNVSTPNPRAGNADPTTWSVAGLTNETVEGTQDCDFESDRGTDFYGRAEADFNGVNPRNKTEADWNFDTVVGNRGGAPVSVLSPIGGPGNTGMAEGDAGTSATGPGGTRWQSDSVWLSKTGPQVLKTDLTNAQAGIADAYWLSFYAYVSPTTTGRGFALPGNSLTYGSWHCDGAVNGIHHGWNCDKSIWYINQDGSFPNNVDELAKPGDAYNLRDVDCYDGGNNAGVPIGAAAFGDNPCS